MHNKINSKHASSYAALRKAFDGTMRGYRECGKICATNMADKKSGQLWAEGAVKAVPALSMRDIENLRDVGLGKFVPELLGARSLAEEKLRQFPLAKQLPLLAKRHCVAIKRGGVWTEKRLFLYEIKDYGTVQRLFDTTTGRLRTYAEQTAQQAVKPDAKTTPKTRNGHRSMDRLIRGGCTEEQAKWISHLLKCSEQPKHYDWSTMIWGLLRSHYAENEGDAAAVA